jgi:DNA mismatch repair protein PMS2
MEQDGKHSIQAISKRDVHKICSGQVIVDLKTAVKELVENAIVSEGFTAVSLLSTLHLSPLAGCWSQDG